MPLKHRVWHLGKVFPFYSLYIFTYFLFIYYSAVLQSGIRCVSSNLTLMNFFYYKKFQAYTKVEKLVK